MKTKKVILTVAAMALVAVVAVSATFAYLTSITGPVKNTFTVGEVKITLDEVKVDEYGVPVTPETRVTENTYKLLPGHTYTKDPTVHVLAGSEASWVFVKVKDDIAAIEDTKTVEDQILDNGWTKLDGQTGVYYKPQDAVSVDTPLDVFGNFKIKSDADVSTYEDKTITIIAYAIQKDGFDNDPAGAWAALQ